MKKISILLLLNGFVLGLMAQSPTSKKELQDSVYTPNTYWQSFKVADSSTVLQPKIVCKLECFPNPIDEQFTLLFTLPEHGIVQINLLNKRGEFVKEIFNANLDSGQHEYTGDFSSFNPGLYIISLHSVNIRKAIPIFIY